MNISCFRPALSSGLTIWLFMALTVPPAPLIARAAKKPGRPKVVVDATYLHGLLNAPVPNYPVEAVQKGWSGAGVFEIQFRPDGRAGEAAIILSTGHPLLDETARNSLLHWRCQPGAEGSARLTMSFSAGEKIVTLDGNNPDGESSYLTAAPHPNYPYEARRRGEGGMGVFVIRFNDDGSARRVVVLKSTGRPLLDEASIATFGRWRCRPGAYHTIVVPLTYIAGPRRH